MVSFELDKEIEKYVFSSHHKRRTKEKFWVSMRIQSSDFQSPHSDALPLSHRDSIVSRAYYYVHMTLILYTAKNYGQIAPWLDCSQLDCSNQRLDCSNQKLDRSIK